MIEERGLDRGFGDWIVFAKREKETVPISGPPMRLPPKVDPQPIEVNNTPMLRWAVLLFAFSALCLPAEVVADLNDDLLNVQNLLSEGRYEEAAPLVQACAAAGQCGCMNILAYLYYRGEGVEKDGTLSVLWHEKTYETGTLCGLAGAYSSASLGHMYELGDGVSLDETRAKTWYERAIRLAGEHYEASEDKEEVKRFVLEVWESLKRLQQQE